MAVERIPYARQAIDESDIAAVQKVLASDWLTQGPAIPRFEAAVSQWCGNALATAVNSATSGLHLACLALGIGPGKTVWTSPNTFVASANSALYCGAGIDFVDIDPVTYNISIDALTAKLEQAAIENRLPSALIAVHFSGQPCEMAAIAELAKKYKFAVIEDASHALGATYQGKPIGDCTWSDITVLSFHPVKIITTAEGGMVLTQNPKLHEKVQLLRSHGITRDESKMTQPSAGPWYYEQIDLGFNYRLTDLQAALGYSQMQRLTSFIERRRAIAGRYDRELTGLPLILPGQTADTQSAWHLYVVQVDPSRTHKTRLQLFSEMRLAGIDVNVHYIPVHTQPYYQALGFQHGDFPVAEAYYSNVASLPMYVGLSEEQQTRVIRELGRILA